MNPRAGWIGVVPDVRGRSSIGGAPLPLVQGDGETFLERAVRGLRSAGCTRVLVGVSEPRGPVAAVALRAGAEPVRLEQATFPSTPPTSALLDLQELALLVSDGLGPDELPPGVVLLPVGFATLRFESLAAVRAHVASTATVSRVANQPMGASDRGLEGFSVHACYRGVPGAPIGLGGHWTRGGASGTGLQTLDPLELDDPGVVLNLTTLPLYRRHFPDAHRKRFQKW